MTDLNTDNNLWKKQNALGLPSGSVRAILAIIVFGGICWWLSTKPNEQVPNTFSNLLFIIMGHYFAVRHDHGIKTYSPPPLWLPKGSVRSLLFIMFAFTTIWLIYHNQFYSNKLTQSAVTLILVIGFLLGVVKSYIFTKTNKLMEDVRAIVSIVAGIGLLALTFGAYKIHNDSIKDFLIQFKTEDVLAAIVGFYFGTKS
jgi:hypothetical protein